MTPEQPRASSQHARESRPKSSLRKFGIIALFVILGTAIVLAAFAARDWSAMAKAHKLQNPVPSTPEVLAAGKESYREHCQSCHGARGDGKGEKAPELSVAPGDFTDAEKMRRLTDGELYWQITRGRRPMPSFQSKLSDEQRWQLVDYIRTFAKNPAD